MKNSALFILILLIAACTGSPDQSSENSKESTQKSVSKGTLIADTIIYDVVIKNQNPDDEWTTKSLQYLKHTDLVDSIFELVYSGNAEVYEYFENTPLTPKDIKAMETEDAGLRDGIGKLQFAEKWYFNSAGSPLKKEVVSIVLGQELFTDSGEFRGYRPVFKVLMPQGN